MGIPLQTPVFFYIKVGFTGVFIARICFPVGWTPADHKDVMTCKMFLRI